MSGTSKLYVSMDSQVYKGGKSAVLTAQVDLLKMVKYLREIKALSKEKADLKKHLHREVMALNKDLESFGERIPHPDIPKKFLNRINRKRHEIKSDRLEEPKKKHTALDEELRKIQEKLRLLNG